MVLLGQGAAGERALRKETDFLIRWLPGGGSSPGGHRSEWGAWT